MKKVIAGLLTIIGAVCLVVGVVGLFGRNVMSGNPWVFTILGIVFFLSGISLMRTIRSSEGSN